MPEASEAEQHLTCLSGVTACTLSKPSCTPIGMLTSRSALLAGISAQHCLLAELVAFRHWLAAARINLLLLSLPGGVLADRPAEAHHGGSHESSRRDAGFGSACDGSRSELQPTDQAQQPAAPLQPARRAAR